ncbi:ABC transporter ATP-binding protein [Magnetospira thiophila]
MSAFAAPPDNAIETIDLCKTYKAKGKAPKPALDHVSLTIPRGSFFGLLGPNGAGKSTLINILAGLVLRTSGEARIWGHHIETEMRAARSAIGIVPQELNIDPFFSPRELLDLYAGLYGVPKKQRRTLEILETVGLADKADAYARTLSGGMRRRLLVAKAMVHSPPILVLDEPTAGVDVQLRQQLWATIKRLNQQGTTILLTTHYLEEAENLCDRIAVIDRGKLIACESTADLLKRMDAKQLTVTLADDLATLPDSLAAYHVEQTAPNRLLFSYPPSTTNGGQILESIRQAGLTVVDLSTHEADLEDIFLSLTGGD